MAPTSQAYDAIVLAGGKARRFGGQDKALLTVGGRPMIEAVLDAVRGADRVVVAGPRRRLSRPVRWVREDPPGGGPAAALAAALPVTAAGWVTVMAVDLPFLTAADVGSLVTAAQAGGAAVLVDDDGCAQWTAGCWPTPALRSLVGAVPALQGASLRALLAPLRPAPVRADRPGGHRPPWFDCDTPAELALARQRT